MSKSEESDYSRINLKDSAEEINKKIKKAKSDSNAFPINIKELEEKPEALNLLNIYSELSNISLEKALDEMSGKEYSFVKKKLGDLLVSQICPVGKEIKKLMADETFLLKILKKAVKKPILKLRRT